jgi:hypothetical protein
MHVHETVRVRDAKRAFEALASREGAGAFRDIGEYTHYEKNGNTVYAEYPTRFGTMRVTVHPGATRTTFRGEGPLGVGCAGSWTLVGCDTVHLEQRVWGVPWIATSLVRRRVRRALEDLARV